MPLISIRFFFFLVKALVDRITFFGFTSIFSRLSPPPSNQKNCLSAPLIGGDGGRYGRVGNERSDRVFLRSRLAVKKHSAKTNFAVSAIFETVNDILEV